MFIKYKNVIEEDGLGLKKYDAVHGWECVIFTHCLVYMHIIMILNAN